jgi:hypothetical protein
VESSLCCQAASAACWAGCWSGWSASSAAMSLPSTPRPWRPCLRRHSAARPVLRPLRAGQIAAASYPSPSAGQAGHRAIEVPTAVLASAQLWAGRVQSSARLGAPAPTPFEYTAVAHCPASSVSFSHRAGSLRPWTTPGRTTSAPKISTTLSAGACDLMNRPPAVSVWAPGPILSTARGATRWIPH